jgi:hypothetical protein
MSYEVVGFAVMSYEVVGFVFSFWGKGEQD